MSWLVEEHAECLVLAGDDYRLEVSRQTPELDLSVRGHHVAHLPLSVTTSEADTSTFFGRPELRREDDSAVVVWTGHSAAWRHKVVDLRANVDGFSIGMSVDGSGTLG